MSGPDDLDYKRYTGNVGDDQARETEALLANLNSTDVLFYPTSGLNWQPIHTFRHQCRLFVYCDWELRQADFVAAMSQLDHPSFAKRPFLYMQKLVEDAIKRHIGQLPAMTQLPWVFTNLEDDKITPWCEMVELNFKDDDASQPVRLLYIAGNPIEAYRSLFTSNQTAPKLVYLRQPGDIPEAAWGAFVADAGPLATVIQESQHRPQHVLNDLIYVA
jgi:hypothetical protein